MSRGGFTRSWVVPIGALLVLGLGLGAAAAVNYRAFDRDLRQQVEGELAAVADLKVQQIAEWRQQLLADAGSMLPNVVLRGELVRVASGRARPGDLTQVTESLRARLKRQRLRRGTLFDAEGRVVAATSARPALSTEERAGLRASRASGGPHIDPTAAADGRLVVAIALSDERGRELGGALLEGEFAAAIPGAVRAWPARVRSAEVLLGGYDGEDTVVISALRHVAPEAVPARVRPRPGGWPLGRAAHGEHGAGLTRDYRGVLVLEAWRPVPGAPWGVVVKVDEQELRAPAAERARWLAAVVALLLVGVGGAVLAWSGAARRALERRERELEGRLLRQRLDYLWSHVHDIVLVADLEAHVVDANDRAVAAFGYAREELKGLSLDQLLMPEGAADAEQRRAAIREQRGGRFETVCRRKDGSSFPVEVTAQVVEVEGRPLVFSLARDIGDRKQVERLARLQGALLAHLSDAVVASDRELRITAWTGAAERIYGRRAREVMGMHAREAFGSTSSDVELAEKRARVDAGESQRYEVPHHRADGTPLDIEMTWLPLRDDGGAVVGYLAVNRDVSERKRAEEALRVEQERLRLALEVTEVGVVDGDLATGTLRLSQRLERLLGRATMTVEEMGRLVHPDDLERVGAHFRELAVGRRERIEVEHRIVLPSGELLWYRVSARAVARDTAGRALRIIATWADVSRERRLQAQLVFSDRLASIGTLAAGVAHEINNPLSYLLANFEFLEERLRDRCAAPQDGEVLAAVREARDGARRIAEIVRGLRTFSRRDGEDAAPAALDVRGPVRAAARIAENQLRSRATLLLDLRDVPPVRASEHELAQVALNLLVNAAQATPEGRPEEHAIRVTTRLAADGRVALEVSDTGSGISPENLPRIFDPFFTTKAVGEGSGLGLSVCHGIVEALGGAIEVESTLGRGSCFRVLLPAQEAQPAPTPPAESSPASKRGRVLVLDDEPLVCRAVARTLASDHEVVALTDPSEALTRLAGGERFDVVVCDLMMPGLTGMECHEALRTSRPELARNMIFLTGGAFTAKARAFLDRVPNVRVDKPFDADELREVVARGVARAVVV
jgi:PAS domain S-box-containing protein